MTSQTWSGIFYLLLGFCLIGLCFPLLAGRVSRNRWYGFRFRKAYESEETWLIINRYGARHMIRWASALAGLGGYMILSSNANERAITWIAVVAPLLLLIPLAQTLWYTYRLP